MTCGLVTYVAIHIHANTSSRLFEKNFTGILGETNPLLKKVNQILVY